MDRAEVMGWVAGYERAWRAGDTDAVARLFTEDATYSRAPYRPDDVGHAGIRAFWRADVGRRFTAEAEPVAVEDRAAVVRLRVRYAGPHEQEYADLWVLRFAADGRVERFEEWPFYPGQPLSPDGD